MVDVTQVESLLTWASKQDFTKILQDLSSVNWTNLSKDLTDKNINIDDIMSFDHSAMEVAGIFFPPMAIVANDFEALIAVVKIVEAIVAFRKLHPDQHGKPHPAILPGPPLEVTT